MNNVSHPESLAERIEAGARLSADEITSLASAPDILTLGMLADAQRRRLHAVQVTYLRVSACRFDEPFTSAVQPAAREVRITGAPDTMAIAVDAVRQAKAVAGERAVSGFSWGTVEALAGSAGGVGRVLAELRSAGLDALAEVPLDAVGDLANALDSLSVAGFRQVRLTVQGAGATDRIALFVRASELQDRTPLIQAINPLPATLHASRPTTGYDDAKMVAIARLAAPNIPAVQVDWQRYGPKLAQVALTFGANDLDNVIASDEAPEGRRRAPVEEVRRNIEAAGFTPAERDGRFAVIA